MDKVMIKILQGNVVTQTMFGGLSIHPPVANFLSPISYRVYALKLRKLVSSR